MSGRERTVDPRVVKALGHPLRQRVLARLNEGVASPSELAAEFGERLPNVSYHVRILADLGAIELVSTTPRRGAVEHHYRATMRPFFSAEDWATLPASTRRAVVDGTLGEVFKDVSEAASAGGFDDDLVHVSRSPMALDGQGFEELATLLESTIEQAARIQADSAERLKGGSEDEVSGVELVLMGFRTAPR